MSAIKLCAGALCGAACALLLKKTSPISALLCALVTGLVLVISVLGELKSVVDGIRTIGSAAGVNNGYIALALKLMGISLICDTASGICADMGEEALSKNLTTAGRLLLLSMSMPVLLEIAGVIGALAGAM